MRRRIRIKLSTLLTFAVALALGVALFWVSQQVQQLERAKRNLESEIASEEEGLRVLSAEWDYLNRPDRIEALAEKYLDKMQTVTPDNLLMNANAVPEPQLMLEEDSAPVFVSTADATAAPEPQKIISSEPSPRPIEDTSPETANDLNRELKAKTTGGDE